MIAFEMSSVGVGCRLRIWQCTRHGCHYRLFADDRDGDFSAMRRAAMFK